MSFKSEVNDMRRSVMHALTKYLGRRYSKVPFPVGIEIKRVLISRPNNRLGNQLLMTPLVREISDLFPQSKIDLFVRGRLAPILFKNYNTVDRIIRLPGKPFKELGSYLGVWLSLRKYQYDLVINVDNSSSSGRFSTLIAKSKLKFFCDNIPVLHETYKDYIHMAKYPIYNLRYYMNPLEDIADRPIPTLDIKLNEMEMVRGKDVLDNIVDSKKETICIYTFATGAKCHVPKWWKEMYDKLMGKYADRYNIMEVLPIENVSQIDFKAPSYYSRDIREIAAVMAHAVVFLTADCGMMHLASAAGTPTVALFSVTSMEIYKPYNEGSIAFDSTETSMDEVIVAIDKILLNK